MMPYVMLDENATIRVAIPRSIINCGTIPINVPAVHYYYCLRNNSLNISVSEHESSCISCGMEQDRRLGHKNE